MSDLFSAPASSNVKIADLAGRLLLVKPVGYKDGVVTKFKPEGTDVVNADIAVLDGPEPDTFSDVGIFQGGLIGQLKAKVGSGLVLGRLGQVPTDKGNPKYVLQDPTDADKDVARAYLTTNPNFANHAVAAPAAAGGTVAAPAAAPLPGGGGPDMAQATRPVDDNSPF